MKRYAIIVITMIALVFSFSAATEWKKGEGSHVITELPANVKEKMRLKYEIIAPDFMKKTVRLTGKIVEKKNGVLQSVFTVFKKDKKYLTVGQTIEAETPLLQGTVLKGKITSLERKAGEKKKRIYEAVVEFEGEKADLNTGTILNGKSDFQTPQKVVAVPNGAIHTILHRRCIFVCTGQDGKYELREIQTGFEANGFTQITTGLVPEEQIVTDGSFHLRAELLKPESDFGGHGHAH